MQHEELSLIPNKCINSWAWRYTLVIPTLGRQRQAEAVISKNKNITTNALISFPIRKS